MEQTIKIEVPDGYELQWNNDYTEVKIVKKKELTYSDICIKLFKETISYFYTDTYGIIDKGIFNANNRAQFNNAVSKLQLQKMLAYNKLMNIAEYLNEGWKPNWYNQEEHRYYIYFYPNGDYYCIGDELKEHDNSVYFKSPELADQAMKIMEKDLDILFKN